MLHLHLFISNRLACTTYQADNQARNATRTAGIFPVANRGDASVTQVIRSAQSNDEAAIARLLPLVYAELRKLAQARLRGQAPGQTLEATALVHEAYLRLVGKHGLAIKNKKHFFFAAARAMRDILIERARSKAGPRRGGGRRRIELNEAIALNEPPAAEALALSEALEELEKEDPAKAQIVNLRYFAGMNTGEIAEVLGVTERTVQRHWRFTRAWLKDRLGEQV
jgi:RNA polymerase sigma factor (TIGR02999 family)